MSITREQAEETTILRAVVGSKCHGLNLEGNDDRDEMGVCVEPMEGVVGFHEFEQYIFRSAALREGKHDAPSQPGDLDLCIYSLRKFLRLAMHGNPSVLLLLFVKDPLTLTAAGRELQELAPHIVNRQAGKRFLGYLEAQRQRLLGERGQKKVNRPELEQLHGYDTKYACHIVRLGFEGVELMETGKISLPMPEPNLSWCRAIRNGEVPLQDVLTKAGELEREIKDMLDDSPLPAEPNEHLVEEWMLDKYHYSWGNYGH